MKNQYRQRLFNILLCLSVFILALQYPAFAQHSTDTEASATPLPQLPLRSEKLQDFIPDFWIVEFLQQEDLNGDGALDTVMVVRSQNDENVKHIGDDSSPLMDSNPRILIILFRDGKDWRLVKQNTTFIPETQYDGLYIQDPFNGIIYGEVRAFNGIISIRFGYFSTEFIYNTFTFRWQNNDFYLIGYDYYSRGRGTGIVTNNSYNFLTNRQKITTETPVDDDNTNTKSVWQQLKPHKLLKLDEIMSGDIHDYLNDIDPEDANSEN